MGRETPLGRDDGTAILIAGPTASGKSALALDLAERLSGTVINADSVQVYADLPVLSSRPGAAELARAPHLLFGHVDGADTYSVARWLAEAEAAVALVRAQGRVPILVGGTGLYFKALTQGLSAIPSVPETVRARIRAGAAGVPVADLHARLAARDPVTAARLRPTDPQRILRALEVWDATGRPLADFQGERRPPSLAPDTWRGFLILPERAALNAAIDARFDRMVAEGALDEVAGLRARDLDPALPVMRALGVPPFLAHLAGAITLDEAVAAGKAQTRQYAKRQVTFGRHQLDGFSVVGTPAEAWSAMADDPQPLGLPLSP